ncbi:glycosyltransferase [Dichotomicrobium thermohalophilum]|uniref:Glycosyltransferase involved in cell wall biosynthesis n=1 Tax=Dichotomicrobium thermohalophilum TaxID=933063 RepID=A0A397Q846_9HYPH|nr:glycosyltransferase [Dichotomicrobium thermohalophilum]RIA56669.1 glycosyltransferase involved in cell wall biosynthesis [Dichotomicrobium thermohalophilum]
MTRIAATEPSDAIAPVRTIPARQRAVLVANNACEVIAGQARLIREARARGHELFCFAPQDAEAFRALSALGVEPISLPGSGRDKHDIRELALALTSLAPDVLMALAWPAGRLGIAAAARAEVERVVAAFPEVAQALAPNCGDRRLQRECTALLSRCDAAIVPGLGRDPVVDGRSLMPPGLQPVFVAGPGVDLSRFTHVPLSPLTKGMVFLAIAYPGSETGVGLYCETAWALQARRGCAIYLVASPPGEEPSAELLRLMKAHRGIVRYLGPRRDMERLLARAHAVVFPDEVPCLPAEVSHALAIGRPLISADVPARWQAVQSDVNGQRFAPGDAGALAGVLQSLLRRPDLIPRYAKESRRIAATRFDIDGVVAAQLQALGL